MLGLVCFLLIALYVFDELTYDGFHKKAGAHLPGNRYKGLSGREGIKSGCCRV